MAIPALILRVLVIPRRYRLALVTVLVVLAALFALAVWWRSRDEGAPRSSPPVTATPSSSYAPAPGALPSAVAATPIVPELPSGTPGPSAARRARYGVNVGQGSAEQVRLLGLEWYIGPFEKDAVAPPGTQILRRLFFNEGISDADLRTRVRRFPGSAWLIDNEPNVPEMGNTSPESYAERLHWYATVMKDADPTARLAGPNVLNWSFTCQGCKGYEEGLGWTEQMRTIYLARYGVEPPFDIWTLHTYDVDWFTLPQGNYQRQIAQIEGMRAWLDGIPALRGKEIWVTEIGILWGFPGVNWQNGIAQPIGEFDYAHIEQYMRVLFGWFDANAERLNIGKWFLWGVFQYAEPWESVAVAITLMDGPVAGANITRLGQLYQQLAGVR